MSKDEAMKLALEALKIVWEEEEEISAKAHQVVFKAIKALEESLAKQEPDYSICPTCGGMADDPIVPPKYRHTEQEQGEPVAQAVERIDPSDDFKIKIDIHWLVKPIAGKLYTTPQQRTWVGLTDEEVVQCQQGNIYHFYRCIEAKIKEKNT